MSFQEEGHKVLIIDDNYYDVELIKLTLSEFENLEFDCAKNIEEFKVYYQKNKYEIIISDYNLCGYSGTEILTYVRELDTIIPFIFVSGAMGEELVVEVLKLGATDYVLKENLKKLPFAVTRALEEVKLKKSEEKAIADFIESNSRYRNLLDNMNQGVVVSDEFGNIQYVNQKMCAILGYSAKDFIGKSYKHFASDETSAFLKKKVESRKLVGTETYEVEIISKEGKVVLLQVNATPVYRAKEYTGTFSVITDITKERQQEKIIKYIQESLNVKTGKTFFKELTHFLSKTLELKLAMIGFYIPKEDSIETVSIKINGVEANGMKYSLENTPCKNVITRDICVYEKDVQNLFPLDTDLKELNAVSYIGIPLTSNENVPSGIIVLIDDKPLLNAEEKLFIVNFISTRAANELVRIKSENALAISEKKYKAVVEEQTELIVRWDIEGNILFENLNFQLFYKSNSNNLLTRNYFKLIPKEQLSEFKYKLEQLTPEKISFTNIRETINAQGEIMWYEWMERGIFNKKSELVEYQSIGRNITKQKQIELKLIESEEFKQGVLSALSSSIAVIDSKGIIISVNDTWSKLAEENQGFNCKTVVGTNYLEVCKNSYLNGDLVANEAFLGISAVLNGTNKLYELEYPFHSESEERWFLMKVTPLLNKLGGAVILHLDITEIKKVEQSLIKSEEKFRKIFHSINDVFTQTDINGNFTIISPSVLQVTGYHPEELIGESFGVLFSNESDITFFNLLFAGNNVTNYEVPIRTKGNKIKVISINAALRISDQGTVIGIQAVLRDVTEKKLIEEEREKLITELTNNNNNLCSLII